MAERYRRAMEQEQWPSSAGMVVTSSFGVAELRNLGPEAGMNDLVQAADGALYRAKLNGRNRVEAAVAAHRTG